MNTETRAFLEQMQEKLASKSDLVTLEKRLEENVIGRIDRSQEELARMVNSGFEETKTLHGETLDILHRIAEALDVDISSAVWSRSESETLSTYRTEIDSLVRRVKALEENPS
ncbi:MAG: hypothetical protein ABI852_00280 [Gemmatimonadaceae bacterium]